MDANETKIELLRRIRTEGVLASFDAALAILRDPKAPAPAKATTISTMFRVAGYLEKVPADDIDLSELSPTQLRQRSEWIGREIKRLESGAGSTTPTQNDDLFE